MLDLRYLYYIKNYILIYVNNFPIIKLKTALDSKYKIISKRPIRKMLSIFMTLYFFNTNLDSMVSLAESVYFYAPTLRFMNFTFEMNYLVYYYTTN